MPEHHPEVQTDALVDAYLCGKSLEQIAADLPITACAVRYRLLKAGVTMRPKNQGIRPINKKPIDTGVLRNRYDAGEPAHVIAKSVGLSTRAVFDRLRRLGDVSFRKRSDYPGKSGDANPNWKGGRFMREDGYVLVSGHGKGNVFEHRVVMARVLGRKLTASEHVHHINGIRDDNRPENLVVTHPSKHESRTLIKALQRRICYLESLLK